MQTLTECAAHAYGSNRPKDSATALRVSYCNTILNRSPCTFQGFVTNQHSRYIYLPSCKTLYDVMQGHKWSDVFVGRPLPTEVAAPANFYALNSAAILRGYAMVAKSSATPNLGLSAGRAG